MTLLKNVDLGMHLYLRYRLQTESKSVNCAGFELKKRRLLSPIYILAFAKHKESGNFIIPDNVGKESRVEVDGIFKDSWEGKQNIPLADQQEIENYINENLTDEAIIAKLGSQVATP